MTGRVESHTTKTETVFTAKSHVKETVSTMVTTVSKDAPKVDQPSQEVKWFSHGRE